MTKYTYYILRTTTKKVTCRNPFLDLQWLFLNRSVNSYLFSTLTYSPIFNWCRICSKDLQRSQIYSFIIDVSNTQYNIFARNRFNVSAKLWLFTTSYVRVWILLIYFLSIIPKYCANNIYRVSLIVNQCSLI